MLAGKTGDACGQGFGDVRKGDSEVCGLPPVEFMAILDIAGVEPAFVAKWREELHLWVQSLDLADRGKREVVVVAVGYDDSVYVREVGDLAGHFCEALRADEAERGAPAREDWVEEDPKAISVFDVVACVAKPGCAQDFGIAGWEEGWFANRNGWALWRIPATCGQARPEDY